MSKLQTGSASKGESCHEISKLQTGSASKGEKLSQDEGTSDRFGIKKRKAVKRRREFGQGSKGVRIQLHA